LYVQLHYITYIPAGFLQEISFVYETWL
jgi:hypothetical protein